MPIHQERWHIIHCSQHVGSFNARFSKDEKSQKIAQINLPEDFEEDEPEESYKVTTEECDGKTILKAVK